MSVVAAEPTHIRIGRKSSAVLVPDDNSNYMIFRDSWHLRFCRARDIRVGDLAATPEDGEGIGELKIVTLVERVICS